MNIKSIIIVVAIFAAAFVFSLWQKKQNNITSLEINGTRLNIEVAQTIRQKMKGLSGRESLGKNDGLLFVYNMPGKHGIWMKDMNFAIDIIWINKNWEIVHIKENATPESYPEVFYSPVKSKYIIEVNTGFAQQNNLKAGDKFN